MGLSYNDVFKRDVGAVGTDRGAIKAVLHDMKTRHDPRLGEQWDTDKILNSLGSVNSFDWRTYEEVARDLYLRTLLSNPWQGVRLFLWDKPRSVVEIFSCRFMLITCSLSDFMPPDRAERPVVRFVSWIWLGLLALVAISQCGARRDGMKFEQENSRLSIVLFLLFAACIGLAPSILIYTGVTQLGGTVVLLLTALGFSGVLAAERTQSAWLRSRRASAGVQ
jgi:hypothetical protein